MEPAWQKLENLFFWRCVSNFDNVTRSRISKYMKKKVKNLSPQNTKKKMAQNSRKSSSQSSLNLDSSIFRASQMKKKDANPHSHDHEENQDDWGKSSRVFRALGPFFAFLYTMIKFYTELAEKWVKKIQMLKIMYDQKRINWAELRTQPQVAFPQRARSTTHTRKIEKIKFDLPKSPAWIVGDIDDRRLGQWTSL